MSFFEFILASLIPLAYLAGSIQGGIEATNHASEMVQRVMDAAKIHPPAERPRAFGSEGPPTPVIPELLREAVTTSGTTAPHGQSRDMPGEADLSAYRQAA
jgi:hypothetical protein